MLHRVGVSLVYVTSGDRTAEEGFRGGKGPEGRKSA